MRPERVWYLAYGSNVNEARFLRYINGGPSEDGARDTTPPRSSTWAEIPYFLTFANESLRWSGGGVAFLDTSRSDLPTIVRAWDITAEQFEDVCAQENRTPVGTALDWTALAAGAIELEGSTWYRHVLRVRVDGLPIDQPALTFTSPDSVVPNPPNAEYLGTIRSGLAEHPTLTSAAISAYLQARTPE